MFFFLLTSYRGPHPNDACLSVTFTAHDGEEKLPPTSPSRESRQLAGGTGAEQKQVSLFFLGPKLNRRGVKQRAGQGRALRHDKMRQKQRCKVVLGPNKVAGRVNYQFRAVDWHYKWNGVSSACQKPTHFTPGRVSFLAKRRVNQTPGSLSTCSNPVLHRSINYVFSCFIFFKLF